MGFLKRIFKSRAAVQQLPAGSLTVNRDGKVITSTIASGYPQGLLRDIVRDVLLLFHQAREAQMPLAEFSIHFASLRITAREMRGGAVIFLSPHTVPTVSSQPERL
ncbi:MAG: hypothetical protein ABSC24_03795 [Verrucomicrobiota bacterium]|jgi:hypothetical protein